MPNSRKNGIGFNQEPESPTPGASGRPANKKKKLFPFWLFGMGAILLVMLILLIQPEGGGGAGVPSTVISMAAAREITATQTVKPPTQTSTTAPTHTFTSTLTPTATAWSVVSTLNPVDGAAMVFVPEGNFLMGTSKDDIIWLLEQPWCAQCTWGWFRDELPERSVTLDAYWIYQHEVTNAQFAQFVTEMEYTTSAEEVGWSYVFSAGKGIGEVGDGWWKVHGAYWAAPSGPESTIEGKEDFPVVHVSWKDAAAYCAWAGGGLPTEAQWEKAAKGPGKQLFPWGNDPEVELRGHFYPMQNLMDLGPDTIPPLASVGSYPAGASPYGALDMAGNVEEWVLDWYDAYFYRHSHAANPMGPSDGEERVVRGGSWFYFGQCFASARGSLSPDFTRDSLGFRCRLGSDQ